MPAAPITIRAAVRAAGLAAAVLTLAACGAGEAGRAATSAPTIAPANKPGAKDRVLTALHLKRESPAMQWGQGNEEWTPATLAALNDEGVTLLSTVPRDVMQYCPGYAAQTRENRAAFWAGFLSSVAKQESGFRQTAQGGGGRLKGLMQISQPTARANGCGGSLLNGENNLQCAVRIMARSVVRDGAIHGGAGKSGGGWLGVARDWMPLRSASKRADIAAFTKKQSYCR